MTDQIYKYVGVLAISRLDSQNQYSDVEMIIEILILASDFDQDIFSISSYISNNLR